MSVCLIFICDSRFLSFFLSLLFVDSFLFLFISFSLPLLPWVCVKTITWVKTRFNMISIYTFRSTKKKRAFLLCCSYSLTHTLRKNNRIISNDIVYIYIKCVWMYIMWNAVFIHPTYIIYSNDMLSSLWSSGDLNAVSMLTQANNLLTYAYIYIYAR